MTSWMVVLALVTTAGSASAAPTGSWPPRAPILPVATQAEPPQTAVLQLQRTAIRERATGIGATAGAGLAGGVALLVGSFVCLIPSDQTGRACSLDQWVGVVGSFTLGAALAGGLVGGAIGAAWPVLRPAGTPTRFWNRASGEIGAASLHLGAGSARGLAAERGPFPAVRGGVLVRLGPYLAVGPETGRYTLRTLQRYPGRDGALETSVRESSVYFLAMLLRAGVPLGRLYPYALAGAGYFLDYGNGGGGFVGTGAEWRFGQRLAAAAEARLQRGTGDPSPPRMVAATAGVSLNW